MATIRKRNGRWQVQVRRVGTEPLTRTFSALKDANLWARVEEAAVELGQAGIVRRERQSHTLGDALDRYAQEVVPRKRADSSELHMIAVIKRHSISSKIVEDLSAEDLAVFRDARLGKVKPATVLRQLRVVLHALKVASDEWGWRVPLAEVRKVRLPRVLTRHTDRVTDQALSQFLLYGSECCRGELGFLVRLALATAMRRGELLALDWTDIDLEEKLVLVRMSKNGHARKVPLSRTAIAILSEREDRRGPVIMT